MKSAIIPGVVLLFLLNGLLYCQNRGDIQMDSDSGIHFLVTNPHGQKTGVDPRGTSNPEIGREYDEIPESNYGTTSAGDNPEENEANQPDNYSNEFLSKLVSPDDDGVYQIDCFGLQLEKFTLYIALTTDDPTAMQPFWTKITGVIGPNEVVTYYWDYHGQPGIPITFEKVVKPQIIRQDFDNCSKLKIIKDAQLDSNLGNILAAFQKDLAKADSVSARQQIVLFQQTLGSDSSTLVHTYAWNILQDDANALLAILPSTPPTFIVKLISSTGSFLTNGSLQYRDTTWENATNNNDGTFTITTSGRKTNLRMTYGNATETRSNVAIKNDTVIVFQTKNVSVNFQTSTGAPLDTGSVEYYASGWQTFGTTSNGVVTKELLPLKYTFRLTYNAAGISKVQNVDSNSTVVFQTIPAVVQLQTSTGAPLDTGIVQYYTGGWRDFGTTVNGAVSKELLPTKYTFRLTYNGATISKAQNIDSNATIIFQTVPVRVQLQTSTGAPLDTGFAEYYSGGWRTIGTTSNGVVSTELLPVKYTFRLTYDGATVSKAQNVDSSASVVFQTKNVLVQLNDSHGNGLDTGVVQYYSGTWRAFGTTTNGAAAKELLPKSYTFRMTYQFVSNDEAQDISTNATVTFSTVLCTITVKDSLSRPVNNVQASYNSGGWRQIGSTVNGQITKELLPANLTFRITYGKSHQDKTQNLSTSNLVEFNIP